MQTSAGDNGTPSIHTHVAVSNVEISGQAQLPVRVVLQTHIVILSCANAIVEVKIRSISVAERIAELDGATLILSERGIPPKDIPASRRENGCPIVVDAKPRIRSARGRIVPD